MCLQLTCSKLVKLDILSKCNLCSNSQFSPLDPVSSKGRDFTDKKVPPEALEYSLQNATNVFVLRKMFEKERNKENPNASTYARNLLLITKFPLPGILRWTEVVEEIEDIETTPIQNTLSMLQDKNQQLEFYFKKLTKDSTSIGVQLVVSVLKGVLLPEVGGGIPKIEEGQ